MAVKVFLPRMLDHMESGRIDIQLITGQRMLESFASAPHFYLQAVVDMTLALELLDQVRQQIESEIGERITLTVLLVKAVSAAIKKNPRVNAVFEKDHLRVSLLEKFLA